MFEEPLQVPHVRRMPTARWAIAFLRKQRDFSWLESKPMPLAMPIKMNRIGAEFALGVEMQGLALAFGEGSAAGGGVGEFSDGDFDEEVVATWQGGPEALVEHPVGIRGEGEAVSGVVVAAEGVLVDVAGLHEGAIVGFQSVTREGAGVVVAADDVALEAGVAAFFLRGF